MSSAVWEQRTVREQRDEVVGMVGGGACQGQGLYVHGMGQMMG